MHLTGEEMAQASQGTWINMTPELIEEIGTDTRDFIQGTAFLALRGITFDGHQHVSQVAAKASALIGDKEGVKSWKNWLNIPQLEVADTLYALGDIAGKHREKLTQTKVIAITGSYGKTTVRSMLTHVLQVLGLNVAATQENFNNLIGVPKTLMAVPTSADVAMIECGISEKGEMQRLASMVKPDVVVMTGITHAHGEGLGGLSGVAAEKAKLFDGLTSQGWSVLGEGVAQTLTDSGCKPNSNSVDMSQHDLSVVTWKMSDKILTLSHQDKAETLTLALPAKHWAEDMALAATVVLRLAQDLNHAWTLQDVVQALRTWQPVSGRMCITTAPNSFTMIDDSYNANPISMQAALNTLAALDGKRIAIIGDMLELGEQAKSGHEQLDLHDIDEVFTVGELMASALSHHSKVKSFADVASLQQWLEEHQNFPNQHATVLVKSSHGVGLHHIADFLKARGQHVI